MSARAALLLCALAAVALGGCATPPAPAPGEPALYRPAAPIHYPLPR